MSDTNAESCYDSKFFLNLDNSARESAKKILAIVGQFMQPKSVIDFGCGTGQWLLEARQRFGAKILGIDGDWNTEAGLLGDAFQCIDFEKEINLGQRFDLAICLEVAEHLKPTTAKALILELCATSDTVLFSAAIKGQSGEQHINCRWQSEWMSEFDDLGFKVFDILRPQIWTDESVAWWYRQNIFFAVKSCSPVARLLEQSQLEVMTCVDVVHPQHFLDTVTGWELVYNSKISELKKANRGVSRLVSRAFFKLIPFNVKK